MKRTKIKTKRSGLAYTYLKKTLSNGKARPVFISTSGHNVCMSKSFTVLEESIGRF